jgi:hypothetical protein
VRNKILIVCAIGLVAGANSWAQRGRFADPLPSYYTHRSAPLGRAATAAADMTCGNNTGHDRLVCLAELLKADLSPALLARLQLPYSVTDARRWSNFPPMGYRDRIGPTLGELTPEKLGVAKAIMKAAAGIAADEGYDEIEQIVNADDFLKNNTSSLGFASGNYHIAFVGTPAATGTWELYFGGHHLAFGATYKDGAMVGATPSFRGVEPFVTFHEDGRDNAPLAQEHAALAAMLVALSGEERAKASLAETYTDIVVGAQRDENFPSARVGVRVGDLSEAQRELVIRAIETYVGDVPAADAERILANYVTELPVTYIAYSGAPELGTANDYVRIDGPSLWIELSMQPGRAVPGIHPHSVWRDRKSDYGGNR